VQVHAHLFRHTIVGKLMKFNSAEVVSKFMGHTHVDTTLNFYWLASAEDLVQDMNNPFTGVYNSKKEKKEDYELELDYANQRINTALHIIHEYDAALSGNPHPVSKEIQAQLLDRIPNLQKVLFQIADSCAGSSVE